MAGAENPPSKERRANHVLREVLDELIGHVRDLSQRRDELTRDEVEYFQERLQWLTDEICHLALRGGGSEEA
jgi:hypothetical protein